MKEEQTNKRYMIGKHKQQFQHQCMFKQKMGRWVRSITTLIKDSNARHSSGRND